MVSFDIVKLVCKDKFLFRMDHSSSIIKSVTSKERARSAEKMAQCLFEAMSLNSPSSGRLQSIDNGLNESGRRYFGSLIFELHCMTRNYYDR